MNNNSPNPKKLSLGALRPSQLTNPRAPKYTGKITIQRDLIEVLSRQIQQTGASEIVANLAGWVNSDSSGPFLTIEISPRYVAKSAPRQPNTLEHFFDAGEGQAHDKYPINNRENCE